MFNIERHRLKPRAYARARSAGSGNDGGSSAERYSSGRDLPAVARAGQYRRLFEHQRLAVDLSAARQPDPVGRQIGKEL
jgi:hypothetical protein